MNPVDKLSKSDKSEFRLIISFLSTDDLDGVSRAQRFLKSAPSVAVYNKRLAALKTIIEVK